VDRDLVLPFPIMKKLNNNKILIVDDDPDILASIKHVLGEEGYNVETTEKGEYAEKLAKKTPSLLPDLIILDVLLSGRDGRTICRKLKKNPDTKHIPIIMISAHPDAEKSVLEIGADAFLAKPFDLMELLSCIENYVKKRN
jgi:DNA-binding response OmpR family regulator